LEAPFCSGTGWEESGKGEEAHHGVNSERKWLGMAASRGGGKLRRRFSARSRLGAEPRGERGKMGERFARGGVLQATEARGKEGIVGTGALAWVVSNRERETRGRGRLEEGGGPDGWAPPVSRQRERGGREGSQLGQAQEGGRGMRCFGPKWPKRGKERKVSPFYFPNKFFKPFSK